LRREGRLPSTRAPGKEEEKHDADDSKK